MDTNSKYTCSICYEKIGKISKTLHCGHRFHFNCIKIWENTMDVNNYTNNKYSCPYCRTEYNNTTLKRFN